MSYVEKRVRVLRFRDDPLSHCPIGIAPQNLIHSYFSAPVSKNKLLICGGKLAHTTTFVSDCYFYHKTQEQLIKGPEMPKAVVGSSMTFNAKRNQVLKVAGRLQNDPNLRWTKESHILELATGTWRETATNSLRDSSKC